MAANPFLGTWRITHMDEWRQDFVDLIVPGHITIERDANGSFQFGAVEGWLDYRVSTLHCTPKLEWCWQGHNDSDEANGRGWAILNGGEMKGHIFIQGADDSAFVASPPVRTQRASAGPRGGRIRQVPSPSVRPPQRRRRA
jgi:hypothetical protein